MTEPNVFERMAALLPPARWMLGFGAWQAVLRTGVTAARVQVTEREDERYDLYVVNQRYVSRSVRIGGLRGDLLPAMLQAALVAVSDGAYVPEGKADG